MLTGRSSLINGRYDAFPKRNADIRTKLEVQGRWLQIAALPVGIALFRAVNERVRVGFRDE